MAHITRTPCPLCTDNLCRQIERTEADEIRDAALDARRRQLGLPDPTSTLRS